MQAVLHKRLTLFLACDEACVLTLTHTVDACAHTRPDMCIAGPLHPQLFCLLDCISVIDACHDLAH